MVFINVSLKHTSWSTHCCIIVLPSVSAQIAFSYLMIHSTGVMMISTIKFYLRYSKVKTYALIRHSLCCWQQSLLERLNACVENHRYVHCHKTPGHSCWALCCTKGWRLMLMDFVKGKQNIKTVLIHLSVLKGRLLHWVWPGMVTPCCSQDTTEHSILWMQSL